MASSVSGPEPAFGRIRRLRTFQSAGRLMPGLQTDSGSDLNRPGTIAGLQEGTLGAVPTGLAVTFTGVNLQPALGGLKVEPARLGGRKSQGLLLPETTTERTPTNRQLRTKNTNSNPAFPVAFRTLYGQQTPSQFGERCLVSQSLRRWSATAFQPSTVARVREARGCEYQQE